MTQIQRYLDDTYYFTCTSEIISCGSDETGDFLILKENIFHPQGGGQPADIGWINDISVKIKKHPTGYVALYPVIPFNFSLGKIVVSKISAADRTCHAALHTTGHLLDWTMRQYGWIATRGHHFPNEARVEFSPMGSSTVQPEILSQQEIEIAIKTKLCNGGKITTWYDDNTRLCFIEGTEPTHCAGTHVDNLIKINAFSIKSIKNKKGILRISYDANHIPLRSDNDL
ncbi:hypothetical protein [Xenorhabdus sp. KJ12.1]|uniref:hypothetical protein n=1 Tax=Xenorhabdus sp. KJ12.1 TaxID=1851571 RepID=UPI000C0432F8|nr:hypothetical protein [Xenorhabdus sp. KJ12.1]PHM72170.1 alanyl-tRNA synthetase [Xenorhabdus sp. KJ12.1]